MSWTFRSAVAASLAWGALVAGGAEVGPAAPPVLFNTAFEGASLGRIEKLSETEFRLHLRGQQDARGRNRQATWFAVRLDQLAGRALTLRLTAFKGEYNDRPANAPAGAWYRPVFSYDGETWEHFAEAAWDVEKDELTLALQPRAGAETVWLAHVPPYSHARVLGLLDELGRHAHVRTEVIGHSVLGRPLHMVTVSNFARPDGAKKVVWMQARQHAWEAGTSFLLEGALRFVASDDPAARTRRDDTVFVFVPMINPDSVVRGDVRFNANGFDPNRQWDEVDLRDKRWLERAPEIWYVKKSLLAQHARQPIALALNLHNTEMNEYLDTMVDDGPTQARLHQFFDRAVQSTTFDPSRPRLTVNLPGGTSPGNTTNVVWREARIPMLLLEQRIGPSRKLGRIATSQDRMELGRQLIELMADVAR
jgi:hypothetical protein